MKCRKLLQYRRQFYTTLIYSSSLTLKKIIRIGTKGSEGETIFNWCRSFYKSFKLCSSGMDTSTNVFSGKTDCYKNITIISSEVYNQCLNFQVQLQKSLEFWKKQQLRCVWFRVCIEHSDWLPELAKSGFDFHHANPGTVVLKHWLSQCESDNIPIYAHTMLAVGGLVINKHREVLVVSERFSLISNNWKLPGGLVDPKEDLVEAVIREVREETGIECEFKTIICVRHSHGNYFGISDLYFVIALIPKNLNISCDKHEISNCQWMAMDEYLQHPNVHDVNRHFVRIYLDCEKNGIYINVEKNIHPILKKPYTLFYVK